MKSTAADWGLIGVLSSVCTVLLGTAGVALRQVASHNSALVVRIEKRDADVLRLNKLLVQQAMELGELRAQVVEKTSDLKEANQAKDRLQAENQKLNLERETRGLELLGLRHANERLTEQVQSLATQLEKLKGNQP